MGLCETTLGSILNTQNDFDVDEADADQTKNGFQLQRSMRNLKPVGRLQVKLAQVYNPNDEADDVTSLYSTENEMANETVRNAGIEDPYTVDIAMIPTPLAAPANFQDYLDAGCQLDFCVAIDFTSSNGKLREVRSAVCCSRSELIASCRRP